MVESQHAQTDHIKSRNSRSPKVNENANRGVAPVWSEWKVFTLCPPWIFNYECEVWMSATTSGANQASYSKNYLFLTPHLPERCWMLGWLAPSLTSNISISRSLKHIWKTSSNTFILCKAAAAARDTRHAFAEALCARSAMRKVSRAQSICQP